MKRATPEILVVESQCSTRIKAHHYFLEKETWRIPPAPYKMKSNIQLQAKGRLRQWYLLQGNIKTRALAEKI
jgi:hypothetical protein